MAREDLKATLRELESLAAKVGVRIRYETLKVPRRRDDDPSRSVARGGLVRIGNQRIVICDAKLPIVDRVAVIAEALASLGVDYLPLPPILRAKIHRKPARPVPRAKLLLKPIVKARAAV